jgi:hypothetical protein
MAKKDAASKRLIRPKTTGDYLARLPQFEPRPIPFADLQEYDVEFIPGSLDRSTQEARADEVFLALLDRFTRANRNVGDKKGKNFAPALFAKEAEAKSAGLNSKALDAAMCRLFAAGTIWNQDIGKPSRPQYRLQVQREQLIDDVLSKFMAPHIHDATKLKPFLKDAKRAIAGYVGARETEYDRRKAKKLLSAASIALETTKRKLQEIDQWPELSSYLKRLHRDAPRLKQRGGFEEQPQASSQKQVKQELRRRADLDRSYSDFAPDQIAWRLSQLERVVNLADERVTFGPDAQRDQIAQDFTDQLASAWCRATKTSPTCSRRTPRLKNPSPFARLLETINQKLLKDRHRSENDFLEYGVKSVTRLPSAKPRRSRRPRVVGTPRRVAASGN